MRYVTVLGAGLLVGTALAVIVPEGVHALYLNQLSKTSRLEVEDRDDVRFAEPHEHPTVESHVHKRHLNALQEPVKEEPGHLHEHESEPKLTKPDSDDHSDSTHSTIGTSSRVRRDLHFNFEFRRDVDSRLRFHADRRQLWFTNLSSSWKSRFSSLVNARHSPH